MIKKNPKIKKFQKKDLIKYLPFIVLFFLILLWHLKIKHTGDDIYFAKTIREYKNMFDYLSMRYKIWSSRVILEAFFIIFNSYLPIKIWKIMDTAFYTLIAFLISKIFNKKNDLKLNIIICMLVLIYPFIDMNTAGYVTTTIAYVWPMFSMLYILYIITKVLESKKIKIYEYIISIILLLIATNMEQFCLVTLGFSILALIKLIYEKKLNLKKHWFIFFSIFISVLYLIFILKCPGNKLRTITETEIWYPEYAKFSVFSKIYLGIVPTASVILKNTVVFLILSILLAVGCFKLKKNNFYKIISIINVLFFLFFGTLRNTLLSIFLHFDHFFSILDRQNVIEGINIYNLLPITFIIIITVFMIILIYEVFERKLLPVIIFVAGLLSRFIIGFSPTVFASSTRTAFITYFSALIICYLIYQKLSENKKNQNVLIYLDILIGIFCIFNYINILYFNITM